jgi:hypothetical protein
LTDVEDMCRKRTNRDTPNQRDTDMTYSLKDLRTGRTIETTDRILMASLVQHGYRVVAASWN